MNETRRKNIYNRNPDEYDLIIGTRIVQEIFSESCNYEHRLPVPVYTHRVNEVIRHGYYWMKHVRYPYLALEMVLDGEMEFRTEEQIRIAGPGTLYVIPPGATVKFRCHNRNELRKLAVIMCGENLKGIMIALNMSVCRLLHLAEPQVMENKIRELKDAVTADPFENSARSYRFLMELAALTQHEEPHNLTPFQRAVSIMESNFQEDLQIPAIASRAGVSGSTLRRMFQAELHVSPLEYLNSVRMKFAVEKLRHTNLRIKEIALMSGFPAPARFCTVFMEKYHMSPKEFRKREQAKTGIESRD